MADNNLQADIQVTPQTQAAEAAIARADAMLQKVQSKFDKVEKALAALVKQPYTIRLRVDTTGVTRDLQNVKRQIADLTGKPHTIRFQVENGAVGAPAVRGGPTRSVRTPGTTTAASGDLDGYAGPESPAQRRRRARANSELPFFVQQQNDAGARRSRRSDDDFSFFVQQQNDRSVVAHRRLADRQELASQRLRRRFRRTEVNELANLVDEASTLSPMLSGFGSREDEALMGRVVRGAGGGGRRRPPGGNGPGGASWENFFQAHGRYGGPLRYVPGGFGQMAGGLAFLGAMGGTLGLASAARGVGTAVDIGDELMRAQEGMRFTLGSRGVSAGQADALFGATRDLAIQRAGVVDRSSLFADAARLGMPSAHGSRLGPEDVMRVLTAASSVGVVSGRGTQATNAVTNFAFDAMDRGAVDFRMLRQLEGETGLDVFGMLGRARGQTPQEVRAMSMAGYLAPVKSIRDITLGIEQQMPNEKVKELSEKSLPQVAARMKAAFDVRVLGEFGRGLEEQVTPALVNATRQLDRMDLTLSSRALGRGVGTYLGALANDPIGMLTNPSQTLGTMGGRGLATPQGKRTLHDTLGELLGGVIGRNSYSVEHLQRDVQANEQPPRDLRSSSRRDGGGGGPPPPGMGGGLGGGGNGFATGMQSSGNAELARSMQAAGYSAQDILNACGPIAMAALAQQNGVNVSPGQIARAAQDAGEFDPSRGVTDYKGFETNALDRLGLQAVVMDPTQDRAAALQRMQNGKYTAINTPGHYFVGQGYDPSTGLVDTGNTGPSYASHGGKRYMSLDEIGQAGGGIYSFVGAGPRSGPNGAIPLGTNNPELRAHARQQALANGLDPVMFERQIEQESHFNPQARGPILKNGDQALGIAQFTGQTAHDRGLRDPFDPFESLSAAARYDKDLISHFGGDVQKGIRAYNAGPGNVASGAAYGFAENNAYAQAVFGTGAGGGVTVNVPVTVIGQMTDEQKASLSHQIKDHVADALAGGLEQVGATMAGR